MFVKSLMIPKLKSIFVNKGNTVQDALDKLEKYQIDGLPILEGDIYIGMVTRYTIYENFFKAGIDKDSYLQQTKVEDIATHSDTFIEGEEIFERTLLMLKDFPVLAVVNEKRQLLGVVTRYDVLEQFQSAFGMHKPGVRIAFTSVETEGRIARLAEIAKQMHEQIISLVTFDETDKLVRRIVLKIEKRSNINKFIKKLEESGFRILDIEED
ncbi:CBS domain-containing protein [Bacillus sp. HMF5848]|uniref:CBS domain-containing protein n=1 Tax=Bacillus sp. HMF5848 TaxID=2495421 RepID=UPI000F77ADFC|nr:CBS domain-containing protein [Bacillus sp. HMF5848]RSK27463.1 CBS domain-containing protein [Bacillus sp. HMF5848]